MRDIIWFKRDVAPNLKGYEIEYRFFENGDLGDLNQIEFNSTAMGGEIDFWSSGWVSVHLVDYIKGVELINILLKPEEHLEKEETLKKVQELLRAC